MIMKKVAIVGASGYSGEELVRLLLSHPQVELAAVTSRQYAGQTLAQIFPRFANHPRAKSLHFSEPKAGLIKQTGIIADSLRGVSGAGRKAEADYLFVECNESARPYGLPKHRHLSEIEQELSVVANAPVTIQFTPHLIPLNRGILTTLYLAPEKHFSDAQGMNELGERISRCYHAAYGDEPFVRLLAAKALPDTKNVAGTNVIEIAWRLDPRTGRLIVMSAEDNLVKGASGQAVQSMNIMCGFPETAGLI